MRVLNAIQKWFVTSTNQTHPKFLLEETLDRYFALKGEILEREAAEHQRILENAAEKCPAILKEVGEMRQRAAALRKEAGSLGPVEAEVKRREAQSLEESATRRLEKMPNTPEVMRPRLQKAMDGTRRILDSLAEREARKEERAKVLREGEEVYSRWQGDRKVIFFRSRYFLWGRGYEDQYMTDSLGQLTDYELQQVADHQAKTSAL